MLKKDPQVSGTGTDFLSGKGRVLAAQVSVGQVKSKKRRQNFFHESRVARNQGKLVLTSYAREPHFNGPSTKRRVPPSRN
jgi:hypothetical protein